MNEKQQTKPEVHQYNVYPHLLHFSSYCDKKAHVVGLRVTYYSSYESASSVFVPAGVVGSFSSDRRKVNNFVSSLLGRKQTKLAGDFRHLEHSSIVAGYDGKRHTDYNKIYLKPDKLEYMPAFEKLIQMYKDYLKRYREMYWEHMSKDDREKLEEYEQKECKVVVIKPHILDDIKL